jgi:aspartyl/asparaginyl-tRNA synthetase
MVWMGACVLVVGAEGTDCKGGGVRCDKPEAVVAAITASKWKKRDMRSYLSGIQCSRMPPLDGNCVARAARACAGRED